MKIFPKRYVGAIQRVTSVEELLDILSTWIDLVLLPGSPLLDEIASQTLTKTGATTSPRVIKTAAREEMLRLTEREDLHSILILSIIECFSQWDSTKGTDLVNWLSWRIPYQCSKYITQIVTKPISPFIESYDPDYSSIEDKNWRENISDIICAEVGISRQLKYYYSERDNNESDESDC